MTLQEALAELEDILIDTQLIDNTWQEADRIREELRVRLTELLIQLAN